MLKSTYDTTDNGTVDNSELLEGNDSSYHLSRSNHTGTQLASTISDFDTEVSNNANVLANTAKISNATHTGDVTGSTALTIANNAVTTAKIADGNVTTAKLSNSGVIAGSYTNANITVDAKGRITLASNGSVGSGGVTQTSGNSTVTYSIGTVYTPASGTTTMNWVKTGKDVTFTLEVPIPVVNLSSEASSSGFVTIGSLPYSASNRGVVNYSFSSPVVSLITSNSRSHITGNTITITIGYFNAFNTNRSTLAMNLIISGSYITT